MSLANKITLLRVILAPTFFVLYFLPWVSGGEVWVVALLWLIFLVAEISDGLDGMAARRLGETSDFGRLFDPFADTLAQLTFFLCFVLDGILPAALFLVVVYREFGILFLRNLMLRKGVTMGARLSGKAKTVAYITACSAALVHSSLVRLDVAALSALAPAFRIAAVATFAISVVFSVASFFDYLGAYRAVKKAD
ncbi:MAG: CDP-diacylglycerol--glycerol-3-phosphate 3-phosphatidyltransferase [Treponema sp.]|nr:CDP-diacylglycerol--glycerol-3-phosphate 3-phosphatidyltransferase [Treponema sp.]